MKRKPTLLPADCGKTIEKGEFMLLHRTFEYVMTTLYRYTELVEVEDPVQRKTESVMYKVEKKTDL